MMHSDDHQDLAQSDTASSTTRSTATADNLVGPGRTLGLLLSRMGRGLEAFLNRRARQLNLGPEAVARDIRRLRRHEEISLFVRFAAPYAFLTKSQEKDLRSLCKKLLKYARSPVLSTQLKALGEITDLAIGDPFIRSTLHNCNLSQLVPAYKEPDLILATSRAFGSIENVEIHNLWTCALLWHQESENLTDDSPVILALKDSIKNSESSFVAARYLTNILCNRDGGSFHAQWYLCWDVWHAYLEMATSFPDNVEWSNINKYGEFPIIQLVDFTKTATALTLVRHAKSIPGLIASALEAFSIYYQKLDMNDGSGDLFDFFLVRHYDQSTSQTKALNYFRGHGGSQRTLEVVTWAKYLLRLINPLSGSEDLQDHLLFFQRMDVQEERSFKSFIDCNTVHIWYAHLHHQVQNADGIIPKYCHCRNSPSGTCSPNCHVYIISVLASYCEVDQIEDQALATFLLARFNSTNRYCKLAFCHATEGQSLCFSHQVLGQAYTTRPHFSNQGIWSTLSYIARIYSNGHYYFVELLPTELLNSECGCTCRYHSSKSQFERIEHIDVMPLHRDIGMFINCTSNISFDITGHFPILACFNDSEEPLYLAFVKVMDGRRFSHYSITTVRGGDSTVVYQDMLGNMTTTSNYQVLALRHDPIDAPLIDFGHNSHCPNPLPLPIHKGAMDPTGPAYWLRHFPEKDPGIIKDANGCLRRYEENLQDWMDKNNISHDWSVGNNLENNNTEVDSDAATCSSVISD